MKNDLICKLNDQIAKIDPVTIREHLAKGDLDDWIYEWRIETAGISFGLFVDIKQRENKC